MLRTSLLISILVAAIVIAHLWHHFVVFFVHTYGNVAGVLLVAVIILIGFVLDPPYSKR